MLVLTWQGAKAQTYDLAIAAPNPNGSTLLEKGDVFRIGQNACFSYPNVMIPIWLPRAEYWGARVVNKGNQMITSVDNPVLKSKISYYDSLLMTRITVHQDSILIGLQDTLFVNDSIGVLFKDIFTDSDKRRVYYVNNWYPYGQDCTFLVEHWIEGDFTDANSFNDSISYEFILKNQDRILSSGHNYSSYYTSYVSKANSSPVDGRVQAVTAFLPNKDSLKSFECGSLYYFESSSLDSMTIDSIDFRYYLDSSFAGDTNQFVYFFVYDLSLNTNNTNSVSAYHMTMTAVGLVELKGLGTTIAKGAYHLATCTTIVDAATGGNPPPIGRYGDFSCITVAVTPYYTQPHSPATLVNKENTPMIGMDRVNYALNLKESTALFPFSACYWIEIDSNNTFQEGNHLLEMDLVPAIGVYYREPLHYIATNKITASTLPSFQVKLFPNPTSDYLQLQIEENANSLEKPMEYFITNVAGQVLYYNKKTLKLPFQQTLEVKNWASGLYFLYCKSKGQQQKIPFIIK